MSVEIFRVASMGVSRRLLCRSGLRLRLLGLDGRHDLRNPCKARDRPNAAEGFQGRPRFRFLRGLRTHTLSAAEMPDPPHAQSERRDSEQPVRQGDEVSRHGLCRVAETDGGNRRPLRAEGAFPPEAPDGRRPGFQISWRVGIQK